MPSWLHRARFARGLRRGAAALLALAALAAGPAAANDGAVVMRADTGEVLLSHNAHHRLYPASLTKMMTLYLTFEALESGELDWRQPIRFSRRAAGQTPSKLYVDTGTHLRVRTLVRAMIVMSGNDCATALAEAIAGSEVAFANKMTAKARELGMENTTFRNASGLPNRRQLSSPHDIATLARALIRDFPQRYELFSTRKFTFHGRSYTNHNRLLGEYPGLDGLKTGYIRASGFNIAVSAKRYGVRLIAVVFGGRSAERRDGHVVDLLNRGFRRVRTQHQVGAGVPDTTPQLPGTRPAVASRGGPATDAPVPTDRPGKQLQIAHVAAPEAVGSRRRAPAEQWAVQLGAYSDKQSARQVLTQAKRHAGRLIRPGRLRVATVEKGGETLFRARVASLSSDRAQELCGRLAEAGQGCLALAPN